MGDLRVETERLELQPLGAVGARALRDDRAAVARLLEAKLPREWPHADLADILPLQAAATPEAEPFGVWVMVERVTRTVVGDVGFMGPPDGEAGRTIEIGYSVIPSRRRRGYATEAARALVDWALAQPGVAAVVAGCDPDNVGSIRVLERLGFVRTGEQDGELRWRLE